ncbi:hypothetical protein LguiA_035918 [Lonicera macranthoides]
MGAALVKISPAIGVVQQSSKKVKLSISQAAKGGSIAASFLILSKSICDERNSYSLSPEETELTSSSSLELTETKPMEIAGKTAMALEYEGLPRASTTRKGNAELLDIPLEFQLEKGGSAEANVKLTLYILSVYLYPYICGSGKEGLAQEKPMESIVLRPARSSKDLKSGLKTSQEGLTQAITQEKKGFSLAGFRTDAIESDVNKFLKSALRVREKSAGKSASGAKKGLKASSVHISGSNPVSSRWSPSLVEIPSLLPNAICPRGKGLQTVQRVPSKLQFSSSESGVKKRILGQGSSTIRSAALTDSITADTHSIANRTQVHLTVSKSVPLAAYSLAADSRPTDSIAATSKKLPIMAMGKKQRNERASALTSFVASSTHSLTEELNLQDSGFEAGFRLELGLGYHVTHLIWESEALTDRLRSGFPGHSTNPTRFIRYNDRSSKTGNGFTESTRIARLLIIVPPQRSGPSAYEKASCPFGWVELLNLFVLRGLIRNASNHSPTIELAEPQGRRARIDQTVRNEPNKHIARKPLVLREGREDISDISTSAGDAALTYASKVGLGTRFPGLASSAYAYASTRFEIAGFAAISGLGSYFRFHTRLQHLVWDLAICAARRTLLLERKPRARAGGVRKARFSAKGMQSSGDGVEQPPLDSPLKRVYSWAKAKGLSYYRILKIQDYELDGLSSFSVEPKGRLKA